MAKGRKFGSNRHERLLGSYTYGQVSGTGGTDHLEFAEEDVWSTVDEISDHDDNTVNTIVRSSQRREVREEANFPSRRRGVADDDRQVGGLSLAFEETMRVSPSIIHQFWGSDNGMAPPSHMASSAPVNVPLCSKMGRVDSVESLPDNQDIEYEDEMEWIPPHEYLAREHAHSHKSAATSVFEGVGRTLKGRDMSRVRNAVWSQTGFYG